MLVGLSAAIALGCADGVDTSSAVHGSVTGIGDGKANTIQVTPSSASVLRGASTSLKCLALDSRGVVVSSTQTWSIADPGVAAVDATGSITGQRGGTTMASCMVDGKAASSVITVIESPVSFLEMAPGADAMVVGTTAQLIGTPLDSTDAALAGYPVQWSTPDTSVASVSPSGMVVARAEGTANVVATSGGQTSFAKISISRFAPTPVSQVSIALSTPSLAVGQVVRTSATTTDSTGRVLDGRGILWTSSNNSVFTVVTTGPSNVKITGRAAGSARLIATSEGKSASMALTVGTAPVQTVTVSLAQPTLLPGQTTQATATLTDAVGNVLTGRTVTWASLDPTIASVSATGVVTAVATGSVIIRATSEGKTGDATQTIGVDPVASVTVSVGSVSLNAGQTTQATAVSRDATGNVLNGRSVAWSSLNTNIATVSISGVVTAVAPGTATIRATVESQNGDAPVTVAVPPPPQQNPPSQPTSPSPPPTPTTSSVVVTLDSLSMVIGHTSQANAVAKDAQGNVLSGKTATWSSLNPSIATVSSSGVVTAKAAGPASIQATIDNVNGSAALVVNAPPPPPPAPTTASVVVTLDSASVSVGHTTQAHAVAKDSKGNVLAGKTATWTAGTTTVASVTSAGVVTAKAAGTSSIQATIDGINGSASLAVTNPPAPPPPPQTGLPAEPVFDGTQNTMIYQTDFENYTNALLNPAAGQGKPAFVNKLYVYGTAPAGTNTSTQLVAGHNSGNAVQFQYTGTSQESPGIMYIGSAGNGSSTTPATSTSVVQYWAKVTPLGVAMTSTTRLQVKWIMLWHNDPGGNRIQFNTTTGQGGCGYNNDPRAQTKWELYDLAYTGCNALQPAGPYWNTIADGQWHRFTHLVKSNTSQGSRDGRALMWIDGVLVMRVEQSAVGVVPPGASGTSAGQPWCVQADVDNIIAGYGIGSPEFGGPLTDGSTPITIAIDDFNWWRQ